ncbi:hypothetical protein TTHERM_00266350 (macronuclear) [Tetrahymena thermophila SB210]|uniref:Uncharacterized protein n=1 Tax=Tetrahymena thermophila (strain SB210) TaxID=312017 RepID=I7ME71_TETTS|nr:hypothetical protein TTHERM_00266350 [Tetrahymena thermophila SB210]EAR95625.2 hypothetical protein TTHERM_00266350 [Tetrahymena thermophila SB210]|eukprot:XP_001015870.2 hypothetical protein TTHERM_00266350 [Tetrahymena thermophila SB210]
MNNKQKLINFQKIGELINKNQIGKMIKVVFGEKCYNLKKQNFIYGYAFMINSVNLNEISNQDLKSLIEYTVVQQKLLCYEFDNTKVCQIFKISSKDFKDKTITSSLQYEDSNKDVLLTVARDLREQNQSLLNWLNKQEKDTQCKILNILQTNINSLDKKYGETLKITFQKIIKERKSMPQQQSQ